jgi:hypothetical protein
MFWSEGHRAPRLFREVLRFLGWKQGRPQPFPVMVRNRMGVRVGVKGGLEGVLSF